MSKILKNLVLEFKNFNLVFSRGEKKIIGLKNINLKIYPNSITALIGKSGSGKSTLLWSINRMNEQIDNNKTSGEILFFNKSIYSSEISIEFLRNKIGLIFQKPTPFLMSVYENVAFAYRIHSNKSEVHIKNQVERVLKEVELWDEVHDRLNDLATDLSGGQQQRLCIARCLINEPDLILLDEPTSALDPLSKKKIEELLFGLKDKYTIILVTHSLRQASTISDYVAYMEAGEIIEFQKTKYFFLQPAKAKSQAFIKSEE